MMRLRFLLLLLALPLFAQEGEGVLQVIVRDFVSGQPVVGARLTLHSRPAASGVTDANGAFTFTNVRAGDYTMRVTHLGYVDSNYDLKTPAITMPAGSVTVTKSIDLTPTATIEGRVIDEAGKPIPGAVVIASRTASFQGIPAETIGKDGYRLENLPPGSQRLTVRIPFSERKASVRRDEARGEIWALPPGFTFPAAVDTPAGVRLHDFDLAVRRVRVVDVKGRVMDAASREPLANVAVELNSASGITPNDGAFELRAVNADGTFEWPLLEPGSYRVLVHYPAGLAKLPFITQLDVMRDGEHEITLRVPAPVRLEGRVRLPDNAKEKLGTFQVTARQSLGNAGEATAAIGDDGAFALDGIPPGHLMINARWTGEHPKGWYVAAIRFGSSTGARAPVVIGEGGNPTVEIEIGDNGGSISGRVPPAAGEELPFSVLIAPNGGGFWGAAPTRVQPDGTFTADSLAPGEYEIRAANCTNKSIVKVERGATATVELERCR